MRILTWNINGVRTLPQYHPWNTFKTHDDILNNLEADIICFQEVKSSRSALPKPVALPASYDAFFSFPVRKSGYSGVATYTRNSIVVPLKAEEGLCGMMEPKPILSPKERVSGPLAYPQKILRDEELRGPRRTEEEDELWEEPDYKDLDSEGRALVLDFGLFVLINVYCPNDGNGTEERDRYKADFHRVLKARIQGLVEKEGREVVLVGDINACAAVIDHCEGHLMVAKGIAQGRSGEEGFWGKDARRWLRDLLVDEERDDTMSKGYVVDIMRRLYPDRKGMYTCWNTKISARDSNYGTRIDYILITPGLLPWVKGADIQPHIKGSDHCPVYLDLLDEIPDPNREGASIKLEHVLGVKPSTDGKRDPPRVASKFWLEYSGKQMLLMKFFGKKNGDDETSGTASSTNASNDASMPSTTELFSSAPEPYEPDVLDILGSQAEPQFSPDASQTSSSSSFTAIAATPTNSPPSTSSTSASQHQPEVEPQLQPNTAQSSSPTLKTSSSSAIPKKTMSILSIPSPTAKRKLTTETLSRSRSSSKRQKQQQKTQGQGQGQGPGQTKLSTFFGKPPAPPATSRQSSKSQPKSKSRDPEPDVENEPTAASNEDTEIIDIDVEADYRLALITQEQEEEQTFFSCSQANDNRNGNGNSKQVWSTLLAPTSTPKCTVHGEPAKELTVTKQGPNRGKKFFICARPVGPGYDKGRADRLREHVDPQWRCDFFKWSSDVRKEMTRGR